MQVKIKMNNLALKKLSNAQLTALEMTAEAVKTDVISENVMPFDSGTMQNDSTSIDTSKIAAGKMSISSNTPYARRMYFHPEYNFQKSNNPNAKGKWYEDWISGSRRQWVNEMYKKFYKKQTGV